MNSDHMAVISITSPIDLDDHYLIPEKKNFSRNPCGPPQGWRQSKNLFIFSRKLYVLFYLGSSSNFSQMNFFVNEQHWKVPEVVFLEAVYPMTLSVTLISPQAETFSSNIYVWKDAVFHGLSPGIKTFLIGNCSNIL
jgi:hypothetical protein